ncbi:MAG TPA: GNAT family N-acetyltransferase [Polyangia bacterium]|nr:GNAT family N-acetyltransferase [Polyangia bacterium]
MAADENRRIIGLAPMFEEHAMGKSALGLMLQPFGRSHSMETMTDEPIVLLRRHAEDRAIAALLAHLSADAHRGRWDIAVVRRYGSVRPRLGAVALSPLLDCFELSRPVSGPLILPLPSTFDEFRRHLSKSMRDNLAYYPRRLSREQGEWSVEFVRDREDVSVATQEMIELHRQRSQWSHGVRHRNHIAGEHEAAFLHGWFQRIADQGQVSLVRLRVGSRVAAVQAFVEFGGALVPYYSGHSEHWRRYSPLTIIMAEALRDAIARGVERVVFPPGEDAWKTRWGACHPQPSEETSLYTAGLLPLVRGALRRLVRARRGID